MGRLLALRAEILRRGDEAAAEILAPHPVHRHAGRQRVGRIDDPLRQVQPVRRGGFPPTLPGRGDPAPARQAAAAPPARPAATSTPGRRKSPRIIRCVFRVGPRDSVIACVKCGSVFLSSVSRLVQFHQKRIDFGVFLGDGLRLRRVALGWLHQQRRLHGRRQLRSSASFSPASHVRLGGRQLGLAVIVDVALHVRQLAVVFRLVSCGTAPPRPAAGPARSVSTSLLKKAKNS